eukprot:4850100-Prymnesium_polylepis.1
MIPNLFASIASRPPRSRTGRRVSWGLTHAVNSASRRRIVASCHPSAVDPSQRMYSIGGSQPFRRDPSQRMYSFGGSQPFRRG